MIILTIKNLKLHEHSLVSDFLKKIMVFTTCGTHLSTILSIQNKKNVL